MKLIFSNIFLMIFCKYHSLQKYHNSKTFFRSTSNIDITLVLSNFSARIVYFLESTKSLFFKKLPLITENGGIFSYSLR